MLSIIISSYKPSVLQQLKNNILETVGTIDYEIIAVSNSGIMGICKAYNEGARKAKFDNLLFIHEDILFHTENWGELLINHLSQDSIGVIGIAGSSYVTKAPTGWHMPNNDYNYMHILQHDNGIIKKFITPANTPAKVFALDGVFLGISKKNYEKIKFNESLKGFHAYDYDFTLRSAKHFTNLAINDILIEHFSIGNADRNWLNDTILVRKSIKQKFQKFTDFKVEKMAFENFLNLFFTYNKVNLFNLIKTLQFLPKSNIGHFFKLYYKHLRYSTYYNKYIYKNS